LTGPKPRLDDPIEFYVNCSKEVFLEPGYTIVIDDSEILSALCGANDRNLRTIEEYLGVAVVTRGNELTVASDDAETCRKFQVLMDRLTDNREALYAHDRISAILGNLETDIHAFLDESFIQIPHGLRRVYPKSLKQAEMIRLLETRQLTFCLGPAGTGKTYIAVAEALSLVLSRHVRKVVLTRPVVEAGESLGFLPGDLEQKISPYLRPLYDAMESLVSPETVRKMEDSRMIEIAPLAYMRGRSLDNCAVILDEAQNTTKEQMKMFLTRLGEGSRAVITGDPTQVDLPSRSESGLSHAVRVLSGIPDIGIVTLDNRDVVRSALVKKIVQAYEQQND